MNPKVVLAQKSSEHKRRILTVSVPQIHIHVRQNYVDFFRQMFRTMFQTTYSKSQKIRFGKNLYLGLLRFGVQRLNKLRYQVRVSCLDKPIRAVFCFRTANLLSEDARLTNLSTTTKIGSSPTSLVLSLKIFNLKSFSRFETVLASSLEIGRVRFTNSRRWDQWSPMAPKGTLVARHVLYLWQNDKWYGKVFMCSTIDSDYNFKWSKMHLNRILTFSSF